ncbi:MAG TPA: hypothetical protein DCS71_00585 [Flavobacteriales bacterium]|nr:hypothetical protein [Flavobacteriales bacterium]
MGFQTSEASRIDAMIMDVYLHKHRNGLRQGSLCDFAGIILHLWQWLSFFISEILRNMPSHTPSHAQGQKASTVHHGDFETGRILKSSLHSTSS